jgi:putative ABC transport system ATP-binding protein
MKKYAIHAESLRKYYNVGKQNEVRALADVSLDIEEGDLVAIIGPSGSGKSTLMHLLGVLDRPQSGKITIGGVRVDTLKRAELPRIRAQEVGFIFQGFNLLSTLTAVENVAEPAMYNGMNRRESLRLATELMEKVGLGDRLDNFPNQLSGGQQQRVAIARALINSPSIILGDEPTGELDTVNAAKIMDLLIELNQAGQTIIIVTHNLEVAERCRTIVRMRDGNIESIEKRS